MEFGSKNLGFKRGFCNINVLSEKKLEGDTFQAQIEVFHITFLSKT